MMGDWGAGIRQAGCAKGVRRPRAERRRLFPCLEPVGYLISRTTPPSGAFLGATGGSHGAVAQLGERYNGIVEVRGSIPLGSTSFQNPRPGAGGFAWAGCALPKIFRCSMPGLPATPGEEVPHGRAQVSDRRNSR